jgi:hypothetical protein
VARPSGANPLANPSNAAGVQTNDFDISPFVYPVGPSVAPFATLLPNTPASEKACFYEADMNIGQTAPAADNELNIPCGEYRLVAWAEDRVGLVSSPSNTATSGAGTTNGWDGVTDVFEIRRVNSITLTITEVGFLGMFPDAAHANGPGAADDKFQRWVRIWIGGPNTLANQGPNGLNTTPPSVFDRFVLLDGALGAFPGRGTVVLGPADVANANVSPQGASPVSTICPSDGLFVGVKDPYHSLLDTVPLVLNPLPSSDYTASVLLDLGDYDNNNRVTGLDFSLFLAYYGTTYTQNDITAFGPAPTTQYHLDASGDRKVLYEDFGYINANLNKVGDLPPGYYHSAPGRNAGDRGDTVSVALLQSMGIGEAPKYDFDHDGWVTRPEMLKVLDMKMSGRWGRGR